METKPSMTEEEFMEIVKRLRHCKDFMKLPLPSFAYTQLEEYQGTEYARIDANIEKCKAVCTDTKDTKDTEIVV